MKNSHKQNRRTEAAEIQPTNWCFVLSTLTPHHRRMVHVSRGYMRVSARLASTWQIGSRTQVLTLPSFSLINDFRGNRSPFPRFVEGKNVDEFHSKLDGHGAGPDFFLEVAREAAR
jgi:hypothetical protein